ncbi:MAG TPA: AraC family transcriptional regulator [Rhizomicrobium sp.]|nr:AraC family transcriptional regulator [Rhizomicrobium sp.]
MDFLPPDFRRLRFNTAGFAAPQRLGAWAAVLAAKLLRMQVEPYDDRQFEADVMLRGQHDVRIATGSIGASISTRTPAQIADDNDDVIMLVNLEGRIDALHGRHETAILAGDAFLFSCAEEIRFVNPAPLRLLLVRIPFAVLARYGSPRDHTSPRLIHRKTSAVRLMIRYGMALFEDDDVAMAPGAASVVVDHMVDLAALAAGVPRDPSHAGLSRRSGSARLRIIRADIMRNLTWHDLTVNWLAARHGLSMRQLYRMFEQDGVPFAEFVLEQRLIAAHRMILNPRFADHSISAIALQCGFGDISYFNRRFRSKFGATPSKVRAA